MLRKQNQGSNVSADCSFCRVCPAWDTSCLGHFQLALGRVVHWLMTSHEDISERHCVIIII